MEKIETKSITILYILGYGRSGSTIVDIALSQNMKIISLGELSNLFDVRDEIINKLLWKIVFENINNIKCDPNIMSRVVRKCDSLPIISKNDWQLYTEIWENVLNSVKTVSNCWCFVDSSKSSRLTLFRGKNLKKLGYDVKFVYVKKSLFKLLLSISKGTNKGLKKNKKESTFVFVKSILGFIYTIIMTKIVYIFEKVYTLEYDKFVNNPSAELNKIMTFNNLPFEYYADNFSGFLITGSSVSGNRILDKSNIKIEAAK